MVVERVSYSKKSRRRETTLTSRHSHLNINLLMTSIVASSGEAEEDVSQKPDVFHEELN